MAPIENNGSLILYRRIIRPYFLRYHHKVDQFISSAHDAGTFMLIKYIQQFIINCCLLKIFSFQQLK